MSWTLLDQLLRGYPFEVLPQERTRIERAARRYSRDPHVSKRDRDFIRERWLPHEDEAPEPPALVFPERGPR